MYESLLNDQRQRWQQGDHVRVDAYLAKYPSLSNDVGSLTNLVCNEIVLRQAYGDSPVLGDYIEMFPQCAVELRKQFSLVTIPSRAIASTDNSNPPALPPIAEFDTLAHQPPSDPQLTLAYQTASTSTQGFETIQRDPQGDLLAAHQSEMTGFPKIPGFEILGELGRGGMGIVYRARQISANRVVALKVVRNELLDTLPSHTRTSTLERFRTEAQAAAHLQHDNLVSVFEIGEVPASTPGHCPLRYYAMRFVDGRSLFDILRDGPLDNRRAAKYMEPVARALQAAHSEGILHRDLKPHNIMVEGSTDRPLVTDFGLAKFVEGQEAITYAGEIMGTPSYMSPEQAQDAGTVTASADLYSLGATFYHLLTGRAPFQAASIAETIRQIIDQEPVAPRQLNTAIDRDLETICLKCLEKDPQRRYARCADLADDLSRYLHGLPIVARPVGIPERIWRWCRRNPIPASLTGVAVLLAMATLLSIVIGYRSTTAALAESESRLQKALAVVDELFTRVSEDELLNEPGMQPLRKDLLEKALKHYKYFLAESGGKANVRDEVAAAHFRVGVILQTMGDALEAEKELLMAKTILEQVLADHSENTQRMKSLADAFNALGSLYNVEHRNDESIEMFERSTAIRERLASIEPENVEFQRLSANSQMNLGLAKVHLGEHQAGIGLMQEAQRNRQRLLISSPDGEKLRRDLAMGWYSLGETEIAQQNLTSAQEALQQAVQEFQTLLSRDSRSMSNRYFLGVSLRLLGGVLSETGALEAAIEAFEAATKSIRSLAVGNPDVVAYQAELAVLAMNLGTSYLEIKAMDRSWLAWQEARTLTSQMLVKDKVNADLKGDLVAILGALGDLERREGHLEEARNLYLEVKKVLEELLELDSENPLYKSDWQINENELTELQTREKKI
jgi:eukaryotic-like serine/threonine-protein kinase